MKLVVDSGNSRLKWSLVADGRLLGTASAAHAPDVDAALAVLVAGLPDRLEQALVSNVAGPELAAKLKAALEARLGRAPEFVSVRRAAHGLRCGYDDPARLGVDRWVAMIAARRRVTGACCVVSAGTAVTFDAVDPAGLHLGGLIFVGPRMAAEALERGTRQIGPTALHPALPTGLGLLGHSTDAAVGHASMLAVAAAVDRAAAAVQTALGTPPVVLLTGGDAPVLAPWLETAVRIEADLVLEGLLTMLEDGA